jgi:cell division septation protein DedD
VAVFLCGVLVGRGARGAGGDTMAAAAPAAEQAPGPGSSAAGPPAAEPPAPVAETPDELSYHKRLQGTGEAPETIRPRAEAPPSQRASARATPPAPAAPAAGGRPGTWVVQVIATRDQAVAGAVVTRLSGKGYPAFLVNPAAGAPQPFYKVHVGRYTERREAEQVSLRIKKEEQFQPWISR